MTQKQHKTRCLEGLGAGGSRLLLPATQQAEIKRLMVQSQPGQMVCETLSPNIKHKKTGLTEWLKW
jgi:hypothetical protein